MVLSHDQTREIENICWFWESVLYNVTEVKKTKEEFKAVTAINKANVTERFKKWVSFKKSLRRFPKRLLVTMKKILGE